MGKLSHLKAALVVAFVFLMAHTKAEELSTLSTRIFAGCCAFFGLFTTSELGLIISAVLGFGSLWLSYYFKKKNHSVLQALIQAGDFDAIKKNLQRFDD